MSSYTSTSPTPSYRTTDSDPPRRCTPTLQPPRAPAPVVFSSCGGSHYVMPAALGAGLRIGARRAPRQPAPPQPAPPQATSQEQAPALLYPYYPEAARLVAFHRDGYNSNMRLLSADAREDIEAGFASESSSGVTSAISQSQSQRARKWPRFLSNTSANAFVCVCLVIGLTALLVWVFKRDGSDVGEKIDMTADWA